MVMWERDGKEREFITANDLYFVCSDKWLCDQVDFMKPLDWSICRRVGIVCRVCKGTGYNAMLDG